MASELPRSSSARRWLDKMNAKNFEFPEHSDETRRIWDANAHWWDDQIGDGNDFQTLLIEPASERLLGISAGEIILDVACGAGRFTRRMAELGARVVAFDQSAMFIERALERTPKDAPIEYHVLDAAKDDALLSLGKGRFEKAEELLKTSVQIFERNSRKIPWSVYDHLGMAQEQLDKKAEAAASYTRALSIAGNRISKIDKEKLTKSIERVLQ